MWVRMEEGLASPHTPKEVDPELETIAKVRAGIVGSLDLIRPSHSDTRHRGLPARGRVPHFTVFSPIHLPVCSDCRLNSTRWACSK